MQFFLSLVSLLVHSLVLRLDTHQDSMMHLQRYALILRTGLSHFLQPQETVTAAEDERSSGQRLNHFEI